MVARRSHGRPAGRRTKQLGQNFLRDPNILDVIVRESELSAQDVVLEVGGGEGVLSARLAALAEWVHVVELDERLREPLERGVAGMENVTIWWGDALRIDLAAIAPAPSKVVANLPYGIAATVLLRTIELPSVSVWVAMVQREVGERLAAKPDAASYGAPSVLAQLACEVRVLRTIPRAVFRPVPNVDSVLIEMRRRGPAPDPALRALVSGAFAHRRKTLAGSLALAQAKGRSREQVRAALAELGMREDVRAEHLSPADFRALAGALGA